MTGFLQQNDLPYNEIVPGFHARLLHTDTMTIMHVKIGAGAELPRHQHVHEQVSNVISGTFELTIGEETRICEAGDLANIPSNVPHHGKALTDCYIIDVFLPAREDYR